MRIIFMGTPQFAVPALVSLIEAGHQVCAVYTQPPRPGGRRGRELTPSPVHREAQARGIEVRHPVSLKGAEKQAALAALQADIAVVAAYGLILPQAVLDAPRHGCLNIHASLLPRWRGAAPIQRAILAGDEDTGVCIMQMEAGLDTGPVRFCKKSWIGNDNAGNVTDRLSELGAKLIVKVLANLDQYPPIPQADNGITYAKKIEKSETKLNFTKSSEELSRQVRAFSPTPGAWCEIMGERVKILGARTLFRFDHIHTTPGQIIDFYDYEPQFGIRMEKQNKRGEGFIISCGEGYLQPGVIQRAGKKPMRVTEALRGWQLPWDQVLT